MSNKEIKEAVGIIVFLLLDIFIAFIIPYIFNIQNTIVFSSFSMMIIDITYEALIFMFLITIEVIIYELIYQKKHNE